MRNEPRTPANTYGCVYYGKWRCCLSCDLVPDCKCGGKRCAELEGFQNRELGLGAIAKAERKVERG